mmetsp:Transcript_21249/g.56218  ORF Transcript_21249/g.56218 Transcript_21249/m.56218 type:complete len:650 (-) Transcript_21249:11-1960(-)
MGHLDRRVAEDGVGLASEEADLCLELHRQQSLLIAVRQHQREAVEGRVGNGLHLRDVHVLEGAHLELLVPVVRVARAEVDRAAVPVALPGVEAGPAPVFEGALVRGEGELLVPAVIQGAVALHGAEHAELIERVGREAEAELVLDLARGLLPLPRLAVAARLARHHLDLAAVLVRLGRVQAEAVLGPDNALQAVPVLLGEVVAPLLVLLMPLGLRVVLDVVRGIVVVARLEHLAVRVRVARCDALLAVLRDCVPPDDLLEEAHVCQARHVLLRAPRPGSAAVLVGAQGPALLLGLDARSLEQPLVRPEVGVFLGLAAAGVHLVRRLLLEHAPQRLVHADAALADGHVRHDGLVAHDGLLLVAGGVLVLPPAHALPALDAAVVVAGLVEVAELVHRHLAVIADQPLGLVGPRRLVAGRHVLVPDVLGLVVLALVRRVGAILRGVGTSRHGRGQGRDVPAVRRRVRGQGRDVPAARRRGPVRRLLLCVRDHLLVAVRPGLHARRHDRDHLVARRLTAARLGLAAPQLRHHSQAEVGAEDEADAACQKHAGHDDEPNLGRAGGRGRGARALHGLVALRSTRHQRRLGVVVQMRILAGGRDSRHRLLQKGGHRLLQKGLDGLHGSGEGLESALVGHGRHPHLSAALPTPPDKL